MQNIIKRDEYLNKLLTKENGLIKVITGIRRCGKSFFCCSICFYDYLIEARC